MDRLTSKFPSGIIAVPQGMMPEALERLYAYEETGLDPDEIVKMGMMFEDSKRYSGRLEAKLKKYQDAESEGRLVVLPCKVGDTVYQIRHKNHAKGRGVSPRIVSSACVWSDGSYALCHPGMTYCQSTELGKTWFLTREEAEAALKKEETT